MACWKLLSLILRTVIRMLIIPIVDILFPIMGIETKFQAICGLLPEIEHPYATMKSWNAYVQTLTRTNGTNRETLDYFDQIFITKIAKFNHMIKMEITEGDVNSIYFDDFYRISKIVYGDAANFRYRYSDNDRYFASILGDNSFYRRFRWCDKI